MKKTIKIGTIILTGILSLMLLTACAGSTAPGGNNAGKLNGTVQMSGSTSMEKVAKALAEAFMEKNSGVTVNVQLGGSSVGVQDAQSGKSDIGNVSRELKDAETGLTKYKIAIDGIAVIVHKSNAVSDLTIQQLTDIYTGKITNWSEVGGADSPIVVIGREASSGTRGAFEELLKIQDKCKYAQEKTETGAVKTAVENTANAIGYISLDVLGSSVKAVKIGGAEPTEANITAGTYALSRPFLMVTDNGEQTAQTKAFLDFVMSDAGQAIVKKLGLITVK